MALKRSRYGEFLACTGYPTCKATKPVVTSVMDCPRRRVVAPLRSVVHVGGRHSTAVQTIPAAHFRSGSVPYRKPVHSVLQCICWRNRRRNKGSLGSAQRVNTRKQ
jgi:ssDNA-binding Zn-finger/Zn-ribbon topoisomerase 1